MKSYIVYLDINFSSGWEEKSLTVEARNIDAAEALGIAAARNLYNVDNSQIAPVCTTSL